MPETALLVEVPEAEPAVARLRLAHDPVAARGVPAHVTVLFPLDGVPDRGALARVAELPAFGYRLARVGEFPGVVWLAPEPAAPFVALTDAARAAFPDQPPYRGEFAETVPHLTVAMTDDAALRRTIAAELDAHLPIAARATHLAVYTSDDAGQWRCVERLPLV